MQRIGKWDVSAKHFRRFGYLGAALVVLSQIAKLYASSAVANWLLWIAIALCISVGVAFTFYDGHKPPPSSSS